MKTVVITGANHGLGFALTNTFLAAEWRVLAIAHAQPTIPPHPNLRMEVCDLANIAALAGVVARLKDVPVDVLINNAAVYDSASVDDERATKDFNVLTNVFQVNTIVPRIVADALVPNMQAGQDKLIVSISSGMGTYHELDEYSARHWAYSASKAALHHAMTSFALLHPDIQSTLIHPGWMQTRMGGTGALIPPEESAQKIFELIAEHPKKLPSAPKMVDYEGEGMEL